MFSRTGTDYFLDLRDTAAERGAPAGEDWSSVFTLDGPVGIMTAALTVCVCTCVMVKYCAGARVQQRRQIMVTLWQYSGNDGHDSLRLEPEL